MNTQKRKTAHYSAVKKILSKGENEPVVRIPLVRLMRIVGIEFELIHLCLKECVDYFASDKLGMANVSSKVSANTFFKRKEIKRI